jgi:hypothetical protein
MSEASDAPQRKARKRRAKRPPIELPDDDAISRLFPKKVVRKVNKEIGHEPAPKPRKRRRSV